MWNALFGNKTIYNNCVTQFPCFSMKCVRTQVKESNVTAIRKLD